MTEPNWGMLRPMTMSRCIEKRGLVGLTLLMLATTACTGGTAKAVDARTLCHQRYASVVFAQASRAGDLRMAGQPLVVKSVRKHFPSLPDATFVAVCLVSGGGGQALDKVWGVPRAGSPELLWQQGGTKELSPPS
jgi:hypothetical protein